MNDQHSNAIRQLEARRKRRRLNNLLNQIGASGFDEPTLTGPELLQAFIIRQVQAFRRDLSLHAEAVAYGMQTNEDRPVLPELLVQALRYEALTTPSFIYAAQLYLAVLESNDLKLEIERLEDDIYCLSKRLAALEPTHPNRLN